MDALPEQLKAHACNRPEAPALIAPQQMLTYRELRAAVTGLADALSATGLSRFGLCGDNTPAWVITDLACRLAGLVCVPIPGFFSREQANHLISESGLQGLLYGSLHEAGPPDAELSMIGEWAVLRRLPVSVKTVRIPAGTGKITFTSGSTGTPKGVCLSQARLDATTGALRQRLAGLAIQRHLCVLPLATLLENIAGVYLPLSMGAAVMLRPLAELGLRGSSQVDVFRLTDALNRNRPESLILVPELAALLVRVAEQGLLREPAFRFLAVGGGKVSPELLARAQRVGLPLYEGYGLSECGSVVALNVPGLARTGSVGLPLGHVSVTVDGTGEIHVAGNTHLGYLGDTEETDTVLATGDLGCLDSDGYLHVSGRSRNLLITSFGRNISPEWLESELVQAIGARQAVVFGDGDPGPSALLVVTDSRSPEQLVLAVAGLNERLPDYARLRTIHLRHRPLTRADGYCTANGRSVRHRILSDLHELLADSCPFNVPDAQAFEAAASSTSPGNDHHVVL